MRENLKRKIHRLIHAINQALAESDEISDSLDGVKEEGFDLLLILEATVVLNRKGDVFLLEGEDWDDEDDLEADEEEAAAATEEVEELCTEISEADHEFLDTLKIRLHP